MRTGATARERRHTLYFLEEARHGFPVFLDTEVDMGRVLEHRSRARAAGTRIALVAYAVHAAARAVAEHPQANAALAGPRTARMATYSSVDVKLAFDKTVGGQRIVASSVLPGADRTDLAGLQRRIDLVKDGDPAVMPEFAGMRAMHRLPRPLGRLAFRFAVRSLRRRHRVFGTLAVSSLGHRPVDGFHSVGGTAVTVGVGRVVDRPVVRDGQIVAAPVLRLNLSFDHRIIDGAMAADLLAAIRERLEGFDEPADEVTVGEAAADEVAADGTPAGEAEAGDAEALPAVPGPVGR